MKDDEIKVWLYAAPQECAVLVRYSVLRAFAEWRDLVVTERELHDLVPWAPSGRIEPGAAARAASDAAAELAVVCAVWPRSVDAALRRFSPGLR